MMVKQVLAPSLKFFAANTNALPESAFDAVHVWAFAGMLPRDWHPPLAFVLV
jgi:hypothetical protein